MKSKNKGNTYERKISNLLSAKFKDYLQESQGFRRNPDSGSFFGGSNSKKIETHNLDYAVFGDIICPKNFKFSIECKHYKTPPSFKSIIMNKVTQWDQWISQARLDAKNSGKLPFIIIKYNNIDDIVMVQTQFSGLQEIFKYDGVYIYLLSSVIALPDNEFFVP